MMDESIIRRVTAAIESASARRSLIEFDWPECHRKNCGHRHGGVDHAFHEMKTRIIESVREELGYEATTRPDVAQDGDSPEQTAVLTLASLLHTYRPEKTSTYVNAAQLIVDAYPQIIQALTDHMARTNQGENNA